MSHVCIYIYINRSTISLQRSAKLSIEHANMPCDRLEEKSIGFLCLQPEAGHGRSRRSIGRCPKAESCATVGRPPWPWASVQLRCTVESICSCIRIEDKNHLFALRPVCVCIICIILDSRCSTPSKYAGFACKPVLNNQRSKS